MSEHNFRPKTGEEEEYRMPTGETEFREVVLDEVRRIGRSLRDLSDKLDKRIDELRADHKEQAKGLEERIRALEISDAKLGVKVAMWGGGAGLAIGGLIEALGLFLKH